MIYEINGSDIVKMDHTNSFVITLSADGTLALISSQISPNNITILQTIDESSINELLTTPFWKQPCINC